METDKYRQNSGKKEGGIYYTATATLSDGSTLTGKGNLVVPTISGEWLDTTKGNYGSTHDSKGQWQETFDPSGMVLLTDNIIGCNEGIATMEYAVIPVDGTYDDPDLVWLEPQILEMNKEGFARLFVNAYVDYGDSLTEGGKYRFLLRGVSNNDNYVLHLDIPFTFSVLSEEAVNILRAAYKAVGEVSLTMAADTADKATAITERLNALIGNEAVKVNATLIGEGVNSVRVRIGLSYSTPVNAPRLPAYVLDGEPLNAVYAFEGTAFTVEGMTVPFGELNAAIELLSPYDGEKNLVLASEYIYKHAMASVKDIEDERYGYKTGEFCTPAPAVLTWSAEADTVYTVTVSKSPDLSAPVCVMTVTGGEAEIYNLEVAQQYYWQVAAGDKSSLVYTFTTADGYARFLKVDGISNFRDIGGYVTTDGYRVKQGLAFRSAHLDSVTEAGLATALNELGIKTDLDIRGGGSAPLGDTVKHVSIAMQWYSHVFTEANYEVVRQTISSFAYEENYPLVFHCSLGRDRTGTTSFLILGLLGVDDDTLLHEYYASSFSAEGRFNLNEFPSLISNIRGLMNGLKDFGEKDATTREQIEAYLLHIGVTEAEIESIRAILLEGYEGAVIPSAPSDEPDEPETNDPETNEPETSEPPVIEAPFDEIPYTETITSPHSDGYGYSPYEIYADEEAAAVAGIPEGFSGSVMKLTSDGDYVGIGMDLTPWKIRLEDIKSLTVRYQTDVKTGELRLSNGEHFIVQTAIPEINTWVEYTVCDDGTGFRNDYRFVHITNDDDTLGYFILYIRNKSGVPGTFYVDSITIELKS